MGQNAPIFLASSVNFTIEYSLFYMPNSDAVLYHGDESYNSSQVGMIGSGNKYGNPLFINPGFGTVGDYHLRNGSPAIDTGTSINAPSTDLDNSPRPIGAGYDIGAYER